jgi:rod shape-determining protein MreB
MAKWFSFVAKNIGIDLGTANTVICTADDGIILNEPSVVTLIDKNGYKEPYAFGKNAKVMIGKVPLKIDVIRPMKDGVISDFRVAEGMIRYFIESINVSKSWFGPMIIVCVPYGSTPVERRAIQEATEETGARSVFLIEEPVAASIGADLPILEPVASVIVDIGGGTTEVGVLSLGGLVFAKSIKSAGDKFDEAIISYIRKKFGLLIGENSAEKAKIDIGAACIPLDGSDGLSMKVRGRDLSSGIPREVNITEREIAEALNEPIDKIIDAIRTALESIPPELASDISERGIKLSGGGALLRNLDYVIKENTGLPVYVSEDPLLCVITGIRKVLANMEIFSRVLFRQN